MEKLTETMVNSEDVIGVVNRLKSVFPASLLLLWASTLKVEQVTRGPWLGWAIGSAILFIVLVLMRGKFRSQIVRWVIPFLGVALMWGFYWLGGINLSKYALWNVITIGLGLVLLVWSIVLVPILMRAITLKGKPDQFTKKAVRFGSQSAVHVSDMAFVVGIVTGLVKLLNAGMTEWWIVGIIILGMIIMVATITARFWTV